MKKIVLLFLLVISMSLWGMEVNDFYNNFLLYKKAKLKLDEVIITPDENEVKGAVWSRDVFDLSKGFHLEYEIYLGDKKNPEIVNDGDLRNDPNLMKYVDVNWNRDVGADGMAFVLSPSAYPYYGEKGENMGYGGGHFPLSFGVKFDTYTNPGSDPFSSYDRTINPYSGSPIGWRVNDIKKDHIAFIAGGKIGTVMNSGIIVGKRSHQKIDEMEDEGWHKVIFDWDPGVVDSNGNRSRSEFKYTFDGKGRTYKGDIVKEYLGGNTKAYFGFTSSTGASKNEQKLRNPIVRGDIPTGDYRLGIKKEVVSGYNYKLNDLITYKIIIKNTGKETLYNVKLADAESINSKDMEDLDEINSDVNLDQSSWLELKAGESKIITGTKTAEQSDIDAGRIVRTAVVKAHRYKYKEDLDALYASALQTVYPYTTVGGLKVTKEVVKEIKGKYDYIKVGDKVTYEFTAENNGVVTLKNLIVLDPNIKVGINMDKTTINPKEKVTGRGEYTVTQDDVDLGEIKNIAEFKAVKPGIGGEQVGGFATAMAFGVPATYEYKGTNIPEITDKDDKSKVIPKYSKVGDVVTYTVTLENTGTGTLKGIKITDKDNTGGITLIDPTKTVLLPGEKAEAEVTHVITQDDLDKGTIVYPATLHATSFNDAVLETQEPKATVDGVLATYEYKGTNIPEITDKDDKSKVIPKYSKVGDVVTYTVTLENTGTGTLKGIKITDKDNTGGITLIDPTKTVLLPGEKAEAEVTHVITQDDLDKGTIVYPATLHATSFNDAVLETQEPKATVDGVLATYEYKGTNIPEITDKDDKSKVIPKYSKVGDVVTYTVTLENTGTGTLKGIKITDKDNTGGITLIDPTKTVLLPGEKAEAEVTHVITQDDLDKGTIVYPATLHATSFNDAVLETQEPKATVDGVLATYEYKGTNIPEITDKDDKSKVIPKYSKVGDVVTYTVTLENTGTGTLKGIKITDKDNTGGITLIDPTKTVLLPGEKAEAEVTHVITQDDLDKGTIVYPATLHATSFNDAVLETQEPKATVDGVLATYEYKGTNIPEITDKDDKSKVIPKYSKVGDVVTYTVTLENTGTGTLKGIKITDKDNTGGITLIDPTKTVLLPGEKAEAEVTHVITQDDLDKGTIVYPATLHATSFNDAVLETQEPKATVDGVLATYEYKGTNIPEITDKDDKSKVIPKYSKVGDVVTYTVTLENTGTGTLKGIKITDKDNTGGITLIDPTKTVLLPGEKAEAEVTHVITQDDLDKGTIVYPATLHATSFNDAVLETQEPKATVDGVLATYEYKGTNIPEITDKDDKSKVIPKYSKVGDVVTYTVTLENTGTGTLKGIKITDKDNTGGITLIDPTKTVLLPGEKAEAEVTHVITQDDLDKGTIVYPATLHATSFNDAVLETQEPKATVDGVLATYEYKGTNIPEITDKDDKSKVIPKYSKVGDVVTYTVTLENTGTGTLKGIKITDKDNTGGITLIDPTKTVLLPGEKAEAEVTHVITQDDLDKGTIVYPATLHATSFNDAVLETQEPKATVDGVLATYEYKGTNIPEITDKDDKSKVIPKYSKVGDVVTYTVTLENTGTGTLKGIKITDKDNTGGITLIDPTKTVLLPGEKAEAEVTHVITQDDLDKGTIVYPATLHATSFNDAVLETQEPKATVDGVLATYEYKGTNIPEITDKDDKSKVIPKYSKVGDVVTYTVTLENTGTGTLKGIKITDKDNTGGITLIDPTKTVLLPGEKAEAEVTHVITQDDLDKGTIVYPATLHATSFNDAVLETQEPKATVDGVLATYEYKGTNIPEITDKDDKSKVIPKYSKVGDVVTYTVTLENTGTGTLKGIKITDKDNTGGITLIDPTKTVLLPGEKAEAEVTHVITQDDLDKGTIVYPATLHATSFNDAVLETQEPKATVDGVLATYEYKGTNIPEITDKDDKSKVIPKYSKVGDVVTYTVTLENTGTGTLKGIKITDKDNTGGITLIDPTKTVLLPGEKAEAEVTHVITQDDLDKGTIVYPATLHATSFNDAVLETQEPKATVDGVLATYEYKGTNIPEITDKDDKSKVIPKYSKVGDVVTYTVTLENTGTGTLKGIKITDKDNTGGITLIDPTKTVLLPGEKAEAEVTHVITQDDLDKGTIVYPATLHATSFNDAVLETQEPKATVDGVLATYEYKGTNIPEITDKDDKSKVIPKYSKVGDVVTYTVTLENTGTGTLKGIKITDKDNTGGITLIDPTKTVLLPGEKAEAEVTHVITQDDLDKGTIVYPATLHATSFNDAVLETQEPKATVDGVLATYEYKGTNIPEITDKDDKSKVIPKYSKVGDVVTYTVTLENTGTGTLKGIKITDKDNTGGITLIDPTKTVLLPGEKAEAEVTHVITQDDLDKGTIVYPATLHATSFNDAVLETQEPKATVDGVLATYEYKGTNIPEITDKDDKSKVIPKYSKVGDVVTYTVTLENTGTGTLKGIKITDKDNTGGITLIDPTKTVLLPGEKAEAEVTHVITQDDLDKGTIVYPATLHATSFNDAVLETQEPEAKVKGLSIIELIVEKTVIDANANDIAEMNEKLIYGIKVTNNSNVSVVGAVLTDLLDSKFFTGQKAINLVGATGDIKQGIILPTIEVGKAVEVSFEMKAVYPLGTVPGQTIDNIVKVTYGETDKNSNKVSLPIQKLIATDLDIELQVEDLGGDGFEKGDGIVDDGEEAEYTISITNPTPVNAVNVLVSDDYKDLYLYKNDSYKYVSSDAKKLTGKDLKEGIILPEIKAGETIKLKFMVGFSYEGKNVDQDDTIPNEAYLSLQETSPLKKLRRAIAPINKNSNKVVLKVAKPTYTLSKEIRNKKDEFYPGDVVVYDITLENTSAVVGKNIKIEDKVSEIKAFENWTWESGVSKTPESLLKIGLKKDLSENGIELLAGEIKRYTVVGRLKDSLSKGEVKNIVKAGENLELQAEAVLKVKDAQIKVTKTAKKKWVSIGDLISYKITVQNLSGNKGTVLKNLSLKDMMPPGFKYAEGSGKVDGDDANEDLRGRTIYFNNLELIGNKKIEITYILRIGTGVKPGSYKNKAWIENASGKNLSNIGEASVEVINDPLFNSTVIIGKVFHDRDNDGWQDDANAYDIRVETLSSQDNYLDGSVKKGDEEWRISSESKELLLGNLGGRGDESEKSQKVILRRRVKDPKKIGNILIKSKEGSNITLKSTGEVLRNHSGNRNLTGVDLKVVRRVIKDPKYREELKDVKSFKKVRIENFIEPIYFDSAYATIRDTENEKLKQYLEKLSNKKNLKLVIVGYTDSQRPSKRAKFKNNHELSIARANTLKDYLSMKLDLSEEMFVIDGKGPKNPKGSNRTSSGRQLNRRTEVVIEYDEEVTKQIPLKIDESDYFEEVEIRNDGILEEGIPGVRLATVEGLVIETDQFGRYHVDGIDDIPDRGKNFIIKVDKVTLPSGTEFTTENPRVKTLTKVMEKFNFGVKIPKAKRRIKEKEIKVRVGSVFFLTDKWNVREDQIDNLKKISKLLTEYRGGVIVVEGNADSRASNKYNQILALKRAKSIGKELEKIMGKEMISNVKIVTDLSGGER